MTTSIQLRVPLSFPNGSLVYINQRAISTQERDQSVQVIVTLIFDYNLALTNAAVGQLELDSGAQLLLELGLNFFHAERYTLIRKLDRLGGLRIFFSVDKFLYKNLSLSDVHFLRQDDVRGLSLLFLILEAEEDLCVAF